MWIFLPGGLLMPAAAPMDLADPKFTNDGKFDLQVRGRVRSHLENFIRDYMLEGTYSEIEATPTMDYNFRFYTTRDFFAEALSHAVQDIDYMKFKPTAEDKDEDGKPLYADGKEYHSVLNSIWGTVTRLGAPGGVWGKDWGWKGTSKHTGKSYSSRWDDPLFPPLGSGLVDDKDDDWLSTYNRTGGKAFTDDYVPASWFEKDDILLSVSDIPASQWADYLNDRELESVQEEYEAALEQEFRRNKNRRRNKRRAAKRRAARNRRR